MSEFIIPTAENFTPLETRTYGPIEFQAGTTPGGYCGRIGVKIDGPNAVEGDTFSFPYPTLQEALAWLEDMRRDRNTLPAIIFAAKIMEPYLLAYKVAAALSGKIEL